jgi:hypothetical protein
MWFLWVATEYICGAIAVWLAPSPDAVVAGVCVADVVMKAIRNALIDGRVQTLSRQYTASFGGAPQDRNVTEAARLGGFAAGGTTGGAVGMILGAAASAFMNARNEKHMTNEQRALSQQVRRVAATKSTYSLTFMLFMWLAMVGVAKSAVSGGTRH